MSSRASQASVDALEGKADAHAAQTGTISETFAFLVENVIETKRVHLQVINTKAKRGDDGDSDDGDSKDGDADQTKKKGGKGSAKGFLVYATEAGAPLSGVAFISVRVSNLKSPLTFVDVTAATTVTEVDPGVYQVTIDLPKPVKNATIFKFEVVDGHVVPHLGSVLFDKRQNKNLPVGQ